MVDRWPQPPPLRDVDRTIPHYCSDHIEFPPWASCWICGRPDPEIKAGLVEVAPGMLGPGVTYRRFVRPYVEVRNG